jgi:SP family sugar:H+ symporter-like MFS transporter
MTTATNWLLNWYVSQYSSPPYNLGATLTSPISFTTLTSHPHRAIAYSTPYLVNFGPGNANLQSKIFFIWFACCFVCITFVYFMIYETKGLTLEQIDELYDEVKVARKSVGWTPTMTFREIRASTAQQGGLGPKIPAGHETETAHEEKLSSGPEDSVDHEKGGV